MRNKTMIIGCGRLGASIANYSSAQGNDVIVIDQNSNSFLKLDETFSGYTVTADATDPDELKDAFIDSVKEVIISTESDNVNLLLAHLCSTIFEVPHVYVRFADPDIGFLVSGTNINAIYPFQLTLAALNKMRTGVK